MGARANLLNEEKANYVNVECGGHLARLILSVFENSEIGERLKRAATLVLNDKSQLASVVISSFLLNRLERVPQVPILSDMLNFDVWKLLKSGGSHEAGEFIRFSAGSIQIKSSIVSTFLLRNAISPEVLIWNIERIVRRLASIRRSSALHHVFTELQRFPLLEGIITSPKKREIIIGYFQSIKDLPFCERNALFWLHYAMARLSFGDFPNATIYFEQAKKLAQGNVGETRDVNNHFARLLLDSRIKGDEYDDYFGAFEKAHSILVEQMNRNSNRHYPYRQAKKYVEYISYRKESRCRLFGQRPAEIKWIPAGLC